MQRERALSDYKTYRYFRPSELRNPHKQLASFFEEEDVESLKSEINDFFKTACDEAYEYGNSLRYPATHQNCFKLLELAYTLKNSNENFTLQNDHKLYRSSDAVFTQAFQENIELLFPLVHLRLLSAAEINDITFFLSEFFEYKSLYEWHELLDNLLRCANGDTVLEKIYNRSSHIILVKEYVEKLIEAMYLIYQTKSINYKSESTEGKKEALSAEIENAIIEYLRYFK
ncbi:hypothetical protein LPB86_18315 [Pedobacter sp. MC2016-14]|uniref:hypothetical protein n=1 Tax=Pedobacter sp. MC2016-14 TaxID=2897327 RepID=UPI001E5D592A|nr:hypothetical protein [Pedobacter sp. MC2016-14]MCD0490201.1 hypothetical protein [Pedobacter sp. MC2016-14]